MPTGLVVVGGLIVAAFAASVLSRDLGAALFAFALAAAVYFIWRATRARMPSFVPRWLTSTVVAVLVALFA